MSMITTALRNPGLLFPKQHIFLISHMRANTSLFGHIMGSSDEVSGYYEMHIGYYSWKSLIRQKLLYHSIHASEPVTKYYFDKVLHNEHSFNEHVINNHNVKFIFMLRKPEKTLKSICNLYKRVDPTHELATIDGAKKYYLDRVSDIGQFVTRVSSSEHCCYLDAESLISETDDALAFLTENMGFQHPLSSEYKQFELTGKRKFGDSSENINSGHIVSSNKDKYKEIHIDKETLEQCDAIYHDVRNLLIAHCDFSLSD